MPSKGWNWEKAGVLFTGAGFSKAFCVPLASELWSLGLKESSKASQAGLLLKSCKSDYPLRHFVEKNIQDVEILLTCWEAHLDTLGQVSLKTQSRSRAYRDHYLANLAMHLEEYTEEVEVCDLGGQLAKWFRRLPRETPISVLTTNYDRALERIIRTSGSNYIYNGGYEVGIPIKKIHGSVNWIKGPEGFYRQVDNWRPEPLWHEHDGIVYDFELEPLPWVAATEVVPVIIPPTIRKEYKGYFRQLMSEAYEYLSKARRILILGYSFPVADLVVEKLFRDSVVGPSKDQEIQFVNPCADANARAREILPDKRTSFLEDKWSISHFDWLLE